MNNNDQLTDNSIITWGQHKGKKLANVPAEYLLWCFKQTWCKDNLKKYIMENMDVLNAENAINNKKNFDYKHYFKK